MVIVFEKSTSNILIVVQYINISRSWSWPSLLDNLVEQRTVVTLYRAPPHLTVAADFNGSALLLRFINRQHQYIVAVTTNVNNDNTGKGPLIKSFFVGMAHLSGKTGL